MGLFNNYSIYTITNLNVPVSATNGWIHFVCLINKATAPSLAHGVSFNVNLYGGGNPNLILNAQTTPTKLWIDNIKVNLSEVENPPPTLSTIITSPRPGLNLFSLASGDSPQFNRTSIKLVNQSGIGFAGQSSVTYGFTIKEFPNPALYPSYQAHIFLATGPGTAPSLDYNEPNLIWLNVQGNADGTATALFRYKINEPGANTNLFGEEYTVGPFGTPWAGQLTNLPAATPIGSWSMTFNNDTNVTLAGPGGVTTSFTIRPEIPTMFTDPLNLVFGAQPNQPSATNAQGNVGQIAVFSEAYATNNSNGTSIVYDNFLDDTTLDTTKWSVLANAANSVFVFPNDEGQKLVKWSLPDAGFYLQTSTNLGSPWLSPVATVNFSASGFKSQLVPSSILSPDQNYFRLIKQVFTKLQILLPGETAAPGTPTGKTGTPTPQQAGVPFEIVVNAVSPNWFPITTVPDQQITLSAPDPALRRTGFSGNHDKWQNCFRRRRP